MSINFGEISTRLLKNERAKAKLNEFAVISNECKSNRVAQSSSNELLYSTIRVLSQYVESYLNDDNNIELYDDLSFVSHFYENYIQAGDAEKGYLFYLVGAIANVLSDNFGNAKSLIRDMEDIEITNTWGQLVYVHIAYGLDIKYIEFDKLEERQKPLFSRLTQEICQDIENFNCLKELQDNATNMLFNADSESAFLSFMLCAVHKKFLENSAIRLIPKASNSSTEDWKGYFSRPNAIRILWQAQKLMLEKDVIKGADATIQLPTGVGKTKSVELIISAAFLLRGVSLAIVVAPLRALCNEIEKDLRRSLKNILKVTALSDVLENETLNYDQKQVVVLTPEKLSFLIKHNSDIIQKSGLIIFDEAHMFDDLTRGASYELLILRIKELMLENTQSVFISAIMPNVKELNEWLTDDGKVVSDNKIKRTDKSVAFYSRAANTLSFYRQEDLIKYNEETVYIPAACPRTPIISKSYKKGDKKGQMSDIFPDLKKGVDIAIYLACKLSNKENCSAIYVNKPLQIASVSKRLTWIAQSEFVLLNRIISESLNEENDKIIHLAIRHFGNDNEYVNMMELGFFPHFGGLENGLRLSIEHEIRRHNISCVVCTSTLAEGVNLPIKYLFLTSLQDAYGNILSTRKFQNLIGRTARSGIHTEGSLICTDPKYFDEKEINSNQWISVVSLFDASKSEQCNSAIKNIYNDIDVPYTGRYIIGRKIVSLLLNHYSESTSMDIRLFAEEIYQHHVKDSVKTRNIKSKIVKQISSTLQAKVDQINQVLKSIELLIFDKITSTDEFSEEQIQSLATETLAYKMADDEIKNDIVALFLTVANKILNLSQEKRRVFSLAMNNHDTLLFLDRYLVANPHIYNSCTFDEDTWISIINELLINCTNPNRHFVALDNTDRTKLIKLWISGASYHTISQSIKLSLDRVMRICQSDLSYACNMLLSSIRELLSQYKTEEIDNNQWEKFINDITVFQQRLKYGLANEAEIAAYEYGYSDRVIAREVGGIIGNIKKSISEYKMSMEKYKTSIQELLQGYPNYFKNV